MAAEDDKKITISDGNNMEDLFLGYYPPTKEDRRVVYREGLISLDANALLDLYRFSHQARDEFFEVLEKLHLRLFVTHQAALEFYRNRLSVVEARLNAADEKCKEIEQPFKSVVEKINEFANRYQIDADEKVRLISLVSELESTLSSSIKAAGAYDLTREEVKNATDPVVKRLQSLLKGRVGNPLDEVAYKQAIKEAGKRREDRIPPGYAEKKRTPERQAGDYLVWRQLMNEAVLHGKPVLLITDEQKEDWVLIGSSGQVLGPRPELAIEMRREAKAQFQMVTVVGLLKEAPEYLGTRVSASTIREAESIPLPQGITFFRDNDSGFSSWLEAHPDSYFINTERKPGQKHPVLHRSNCPHFTRNPGLQWTKDYVKICGDDRQGLEQWAADAVGSEVTLCRTCFGNPLGVNERQKVNSGH